MRPEAGAPRRLRLVPLALPRGGQASRALEEQLAERLSRRVALPCVLDSHGPLPELPELPGRNQWDARPLLDWLAAGLASRELVLGLTGRDLGLPIFSHVFGLAQDGGCAAVVSLARLDPAFDGLPPDPERLLARALGEALGQLGHLGGLKHCPEAQCLMRFAGTVEKADARGQAFCPACRARLPAWLHPAGLAGLERP
jgi:archaemetzincin